MYLFDDLNNFIGFQFLWIFIQIQILCLWICYSGCSSNSVERISWIRFRGGMVLCFDRLYSSIHTWKRKLTSLLGLCSSLINWQPSQSSYCYLMRNKRVFQLKTTKQNSTDFPLDMTDQMTFATADIKVVMTLSFVWLQIIKSMPLRFPSPASNNVHATKCMKSAT